jgi:hypothetical protein
VRQLADEADRVGDQGGVAVAELHRAGRGIERGEEPVLHEQLPVPESARRSGGLAGVGIAHQRDPGTRPERPLRCTVPRAIATILVELAA